MHKINKSEDIKITITNKAKEQLLLIWENDFTLEGPALRVAINGKECHGFNYQIGFDQAHEKDWVISLAPDLPFSLVLDAFCAHYCQDGEIDYLFGHEVEGFIFNNNNEKYFKGKFFKNETLLPPDHLSIA